MNGTDCLLAFADVGEAYLSAANDTGALRRSFQRRKKRRAQMICAACVCAIVALAAVGFGPGRWGGRTPAALPPEEGIADRPTTEPSSRETPSTAPGLIPQETGAPQVTETPPATTMPPATEPAATEEPRTEPANEVRQIRPWNERPPQEQYTELMFQGFNYLIGSSEIAEAYLGEPLGSAEAQGYDEYKDAPKKRTFTVYALQDVSTACALGVRFDNGACYAYLNMGYDPGTLSRFLEDLNLRNELRFGMAYDGFFDAEMRYHSRTFADFDDAIVWELLLREDAPMQVTDFPPSGRLCSVAVSVPELGCSNLALWLTEDGYAVTNLLGTAKVFYVSPESAKAFAYWLVENVPYTENAGHAEGETAIPE